MNAQSRLADSPPSRSDADRIPQLYAVLDVIEQIAPAGGDAAPIPAESALRQAYEQTSGIGKRGFGTTADEVIAAATVGAQALVGKSEAAAPAARQLSRHLRSQIVQLSRFAGI